MLLLLYCALLAAVPAHGQPVVSDTGDSSPDTASEIISRDVLVADGDTLRTIALRELGRTGFAPQLAEFNKLVVNAPLVPGDIIRIPIHVPARGEFAQVVFVKGSVRVRRLIRDNAPAGTQAGAVKVNALAPVDEQTPDLGGASPDSDSFEEIVLERDAEVIAGDTILTGGDGYVSIEFSSGSVINLQPDTEAVLNRLNCLPDDDSCVIEVRTRRGKVTSDIDTRNNQPVDFRISTPYASAAVRGTVFDVDAAIETLRVGVTEGAVDLSAADQTVPLPSGFGSVVQEGQPPSEPVALLPAPVFKRVPPRVAPGDQVTWWPFTTASSYSALLSNDSLGNEALASFEAGMGSLEFDAIAAGDYFLHLRAVDQNGLLGFPSDTRLTIAAIDDSIEAVQTSITRQGQEFLVEVTSRPAEAVGFEIQISETPGFEDPLSVDVDANGSAVFRLDNDEVFTRARVLIDPFTVSAYGAVASSEN